MIRLEDEQLVAAFDASGFGRRRAGPRPAGRMLELLVCVCERSFPPSEAARKDIGRVVSGTSSGSSDDIDLRRVFRGLVCLSDLYAQPGSAAASNESRLALDSQRCRSVRSGSDPTRTVSFRFRMSPAAAHRERILRERQNARYDAVVESASDAILTLDANGLVQFANSASFRETSFERAELVGRPLDHLFEEPREMAGTLGQGIIRRHILACS